ncbi:hypothetical protein [Streptomyces subrutilus]|nr:hypothetical protein OG479_01455 [Streptomyces subrutilus]
MDRQDRLDALDREMAARQLAATDSWPFDAAPDLLEYALFSRA